MGGSRGGGGNQELEDLQKRALEDELEEKERLEADLEARRRTRFFGGRRGQLRFLGPLARQVRRSQERGQEAVTPAVPSSPAPQASRVAGRGGSQSRGQSASIGGGGQSRESAQSGRSATRSSSDPGAFDTGGSVFG